MLQEKDLEIGRYYTTPSETNPREEYVFVYSNGSSPYIKLKDGIANYWGLGGELRNSKNSFFKEYREATYQEIIHLQECIKAGKFIPFEELKMIEQYQIY